MKQLLAAIGIAAVLAASIPAQAAFTYYLTHQEMRNGMNFCTYSNGGTYAMGYASCPLSITI